MDSSTPLRNTLTLVVSGAMVMSSLAQTQRCHSAAQFGHPDVCKFPAACTPAAVDDASPLSSSSRFVTLQSATSITPTSVESTLGSGGSLAQVAVQQQNRVLQQQQQYQQGNKHLVQLVQLPQQQLGMATKIGLPVAGGAIVLPLQQHQLQQQQLQQQQATSGKWVWQQQQQQQVLQPLMPQSSGSSFSSTQSGLRASLPGSQDCVSSGSITSSSTGGANSMVWQQLLKHQQLQLVSQQQQTVQQVQLIAAVPRTTAPLSSGGAISTTNSSSTLGKRLLSSTGSMCDLRQPAAKKAATSAAVAAMLQASISNPSWPGAAAAAAPQQQLVALLPAPSSRGAAAAWQGSRLPPTGLMRQRQQQQQQRPIGLALVSAPLTAGTAAAGVAVTAALGPMRVLEPTQQKLLHWAGRVLNCQLQDAYLLGAHLHRRITGRLDDMLLISLGVTVSSESVAMLMSLWVATKLEGHRRQVAGASKLAAALQLLPASITDVELHVMQRLQWQPYAGWSGRSLE